MNPSVFFVFLKLPEVPSDFFTSESFATFAGATSITVIIANGIQRAFNYNPKWLALMVAICVCEIAVFLAKESSAGNYLIAILNGFLVFSAAGGLTALPGQPNPENQEPPDEGTESATLPRVARRFWSSWF